jgi:hypothetical protein
VAALQTNAYSPEELEKSPPFGCLWVFERLAKPGIILGAQPVEIFDHATSDKILYLLASQLQLY